MYSNICMVDQFKNDKYSTNAVLKKLKMTVSTMIMEIYNDSIYNGLGIIAFNSDYIKGVLKCVEL